MARKKEVAEENNAPVDPPADDSRQEPLPNVPRGTSEEAPAAAPEDNADVPRGTSEAVPPPVLNADGTPRKRRGRPPKDPNAAPVAREAPEPKRRRSAPESESGWFSPEADTIRCENARHNAKRWLTVSRGAVKGAEAGMRSVLRQRMTADNVPRENVEHALQTLPALAAVQVHGGASVEESCAMALATIAAYFAPDNFAPDHPLLYSTLTLGFAAEAYARAVNTAFAEAARGAPIKAEVKQNPQS